MGSIEWPCPKCGQGQKARIPNGQAVETLPLCAACEEAERNQVPNDHARSKEAPRASSRR